MPNEWTKLDRATSGRMMRPGYFAVSQLTHSSLIVGSRKLTQADIDFHYHHRRERTETRSRHRAARSHSHSSVSVARLRCISVDSRATEATVSVACAAAKYSQGFAGYETIE